MLPPIETPCRIEPCLLDGIPIGITDLIANLTTSTERIAGRLHPRTAASLAELVRIMNCYYSNLIEGHNTKPRDIERALADDLEKDELRRNFQIEARAHVRLQQTIDRLYAAGTMAEPASTEFLCGLHREFYRDAPESMLWIDNGEHRFRMEPGLFRSRPEHNVLVGRHIPPDSSNVAEFMRHFEQRYRLAAMGKGERIIAMAASHHRLAYIHPFADGNGRVSRLMSHAMGLTAGIGASGLWSVSRGLARGLESRQDYKSKMDYADTPRQGDLDGRGNLSQKALIEFIHWFLEVCLDQVGFMTGLFEFDRLAERLKAYVESRALKPEAFYILERVLMQGEMPRGEAERITGLKERSARMVLASLINDGILTSETPKGPVSLHFGSESVEFLFPRLFAEN
ncbi:MAG: Fic family protein [Methylobacter sp.]|nr:Fic family protein [Methylobacter sp.]